MEAQDKITSQIKEAARNAESQAFPGMERVWERVTERLDEKPENKVAPFFSYKKIAAAAAVLVTLGLGSAYLFTEKAQSPVVAENNAKKVIDAPAQVQPYVDTTRTIAAIETNTKPKIKPVKAPQAAPVAEWASSDPAAPTYIVSAIPPSSDAPAPPVFQDKTEIITGKVVDENGEGIPGATVKLLGSETGTHTDIDGNYQLEVVTPRPTLEITALGYGNQNVFANDNLDAGTVALSPGGHALSDVVVTMSDNGNLKMQDNADSTSIVLNGPVKDVAKAEEATGYGSMQTTYGSSSTINIDKVVANNQNSFSNTYKGNQLATGQSYTVSGFTTPPDNRQQSNIKTRAYAGPASNATNAIEGAAPGIQVTNGNGMPGAGTSVQIRGRNAAGNIVPKPLIIVDGLPYNGDINSINPKDIAKMTLLKDSVATAVYGSRAVNGVVIITTKNGLHPEKKKPKK